MPAPVTAWIPARRAGSWRRPWVAPPHTSRANDFDAAQLQRRVATPGGLTEKGLGVLEETGLRRSFDAAVDLVVEATA